VEAIPWNERGLALARGSNDAKARALISRDAQQLCVGPADLERYAEALPVFEEALKEWAARDRPQQIRIAKWSRGALPAFARPFPGGARHPARARA
jgi:hypothetical protein